MGRLFLAVIAVLRKYGYFTKSTATLDCSGSLTSRSVDGIKRRLCGSAHYGARRQDRTRLNHVEGFDCSATLLQYCRWNVSCTFHYVVHAAIVKPARDYGLHYHKDCLRQMLSPEYMRNLAVLLSSQTNKVCDYGSLANVLLLVSGRLG